MANMTFARLLRFVCQADLSSLLWIAEQSSTATKFAEAFIPDLVRQGSQCHPVAYWTVCIHVDLLTCGLHMQIFHEERRISRGVHTLHEKRKFSWGMQILHKARNFAWGMQILHEERRFPWEMQILSRKIRWLLGVVIQTSNIKPACQQHKFHSCTHSVSH